MSKRIVIPCDGRSWYRTSVGKMGQHLWVRGPDKVKRCAACGRSYEQVTAIA